ncbi:MAG: DUF2281 domain-containing protein [Nanoarchaeota archaeon]
MKKSTIKAEKLVNKSKLTEKDIKELSKKINLSASKRFMKSSEGVLADEDSLAEDWLSPEDEEAWKDL